MFSAGFSSSEKFSQNMTVMDMHTEIKVAQKTSEKKLIWIIFIEHLVSEFFRTLAVQY